jgi:hypothetical protein
MRHAGSSPMAKYWLGGPINENLAFTIAWRKLVM